MAMRTLAIVLFAAAALSAAQQPGLLPAGSALVAGRVVDGASTRGVADAAVLLTGPLGTTASSQPRRVFATTDGRFLFRDLPAGRYALNASAPGYIGGGYGEAKPIQIRRSFDLPRSLELNDGEANGNVTLSLWKLGGISGAVVDEANEPMVGVEVRVLSRVVDWGGVVMQNAEVSLSDDRGMFHIDVIPGDYVVGALINTTTVPVSALDTFQQSQAAGSPLDLRLNQVPDLSRSTGARAGRDVPAGVLSGDDR